VERTETGRAWGLAHHFASFEQQREASYLGMWLFLAQEVMFFGGLFTAYLVYRIFHPEAFAAGSHVLDVTLGAINTAVLIGSSLTMALAVRAAQLDRRRLLVVFLLATIVLGGVFLGIKVVEYGDKFEHHLVPGPHFEWHGAGNPRQVQMFFNLYFAMTGLHALHMIVGIGILLVMVWLAWRGAFTRDNHNLVEGMGLYWHFVDIIWIFLFPLLYLLGRH
jgi:cytochrome c oxidase subunit 3